MKHKPQLWIERKFSFDHKPERMQEITTRLKSAAGRIRDLIKDVPEDRLKYKPGGKWSIKENIGHLSDLEVLHDGRIDDFIDGKKVLRPADMTNTATQEARHNVSPIDNLLEVFGSKRNLLVSRLEQLDEKTRQFESLHPRLNVMMKPVDMALFIAEHDDHHIKTIEYIISNSFD